MRCGRLFALCAAVLPVLTLSTVMPALADGPGFDCAKATRQIDRAICAWDMVGTLDGHMADVFKDIVAGQKDEAAAAEIKSNQKAWLAERDSRCGLDNIVPQEGSEDGLSPKEFGQLLCLQAIYPERIAQLMDLATPPLVPLDVKTVPVEPLKTADPDHWQQRSYEAFFSPDQQLMALGVLEENGGSVIQVWLYEPQSGRLVTASPQATGSKVEKPEDILELSSWFWGEDGRFYVRAQKPRQATKILFAATMDGYAEASDTPVAATPEFFISDVEGQTVRYNGDITEEERPAGLDDASEGERKGGSFIAWVQNRGHGDIGLMAARTGDSEPRLIASGNWELKSFQLDPTGTRLFYNGENGIVVTDLETGATRRLKGTRGTDAEVRPVALSADGTIFVYWMTGSCTDDATGGIDLTVGDDVARRVCLARLEPAAAPALGTVAAAAKAASSGDLWVGEWAESGEGPLSASIRRGTAKPEYLVIDLYTGMPGCSGAVTLFGKPQGRTVLGESYDPSIPSAPVCRVELSLDDKGNMKVDAAGPCTYYHGAGCGFDGSLRRSE